MKKRWNSIWGVEEIFVTASGYTQNGVTLKTIVWTRNLNDSFRACSEVRVAIVKEFKRNGIVIPYQTVTLAELEHNGTEL